MTPIEFASELLTRLSLPVTENNIAALVGLQVQEGGHVANSASFNPMNVTQIIKGVSHLAPGFSEKGPQIQAYPDWETGLQATATLFKNGFYKGVLASLARSAPPNDTLREIALSPYGWYEIKGGKRRLLPYPAATAAAAAWRVYGSKPFPDSSGGWFAMSESALKQLFQPRSVKYGLVAFAGMTALLGIALVSYGVHKHRSA